MEPMMSVTLSIKHAPDDVVDRLKDRAKRNHRSLQGELLAIIEESVRLPPRLTPDEIFAKVKALGLKSPSESTAMIRADRDAR